MWMLIAFGAPVITADGVQIGTADKMIFNPASGQTEKVVVHKGHLFGRDVAIELDRVRAAAPEGVQLALTRQQVEQLPDFYAADYQLPPTTWIPPYDWPAGGVLWAGAIGAAYPMAPPVETRPPGPLTERDDVVVESGTTVLTRDGDNLGQIANVVLDVESGKPARLIVRRGVIFTHDVEIPGDWLDHLEAGVVQLSVDRAAVEELARKQRKQE